MIKTELETLTLRLVGSEDLGYYWMTQIDDSGCVEVSCTVIGETEPDQIVSMDPAEALLVAQNMILAATEELKKQAF